MHAYNALGFALGADINLLPAVEPVQTAYSLPTSRLTGKMVIPLDRTGAIATGAPGKEAVAEADPTTGVIRDQSTGQVIKMGGGIPWMLVGAGVLGVAGLYLLMRKKRGAVAGFGRYHRRRRRR